MDLVEHPTQQAIIMQTEHIQEKKKKKRKEKKQKQKNKQKDE